jgi:hypothetical protein
MANALTDLNRELWAKEMHLEREKNLCAMSIVNMELRDGLSDGDTVNRPRRSRLKSQSYTKGTDFTPVDVTGTNEQLTVDSTQCIPIYLDQIDNVQNSYDSRAVFGKDMIEDLNRHIDAAVFSEYDQATSLIRNSDVGGSGTGAVPVTVSNVNRIFSAAARKLTNLRVSPQDRFAVISPSVLEQLQLYTAGKDTSFGDVVEANGKIGSRFGFEIYVSQNLTFTAVWTPADQPSDGDTIAINGVTITFETGTVDTAGMVKSETSTAVTLDNLVAFLNAPATSVSAKYQALTDADSLAALEGLVATDGTTYLGIEHVGGGEVVVAGSEAGDVWSAQTVHCVFGQKKAIDLVLQMTPSIGFNQKPLGLPGSGYLVASCLRQEDVYPRERRSRRCARRIHGLSPVLNLWGRETSPSGSI